MGINPQAQKNVQKKLRPETQIKQQTNRQTNKMFNLIYRKTKEIQIILRLFLVLAMYCQASSINHSTFHIASWVGRKPKYKNAVGSNSLEITYILFELPQ